MRGLFVIFLFLCCCPFLSIASSIATEGWKTYLSYYHTNSVEESNEQVFVVAEGSLYTYGKEDQSIRPYYKGNGLNDNTISLIRYNRQTSSLLIVYDNSNIDILEGHTAVNLPYLYTSTSFREKRVNTVLIQDRYAYLCTAFGIVVIDMERKEVKDTYNLTLNITSCAVLGDYIYACTTDRASAPSGILRASLNDNLLDRANWSPYELELPAGYTIESVASFQERLFYLVEGQGVFFEQNGLLTRSINSASLKEIKNVGDRLVAIDQTRLFFLSGTNTFEQVNIGVNDVSTYQTDIYWIAEGDKGLRSIRRVATNSFEARTESLVLDGPYSNSAYKVICQDGKLYMIIGGKNPNGTRMGNQGYLLQYADERWSFVPPGDVYNLLHTSRNPRDYTSFVVTAGDGGEEIVYASSFGDGVVQYTDGVPTQVYNHTNYLSETAGGNGNGYNFIDGLSLDAEGNLWMTNSEVNHAVAVLDAAGEWHYLDIPALRGLYTINDIYITSRGDKWINVPRVDPKLVMIPASESLDEVESYEFTSLIDTEGNEYTPSSYTCVAEDKDGYVWIGSDRGAVYFTNPRVTSEEDRATKRCRRVVYTNEETGNLAYFLDNIVVTAIAVDAGNRKWFGTRGNGVYVLDQDNETIVHQFNTSNSPLLSDYIYDIEIDDETGEVFIGTDKGLNSYQGEASAGKPDYSGVYAYPNPVRPEYADKVTIVGLMENSNVKITDLSGNIIYQTRSLGGQATWNCQRPGGGRVASGVYLVLAHTEEAGESVVTKIVVVR